MPAGSARIPAGRPGSGPALRHGGFSLLELMVVIVIIAILFTFTTLSIRSDDPVDLIKEEALRFNQLLQMLLDEAILRGEDFGIEFATREYRFVRLTREGWATIENDSILRPRELPQDMELDLAVEQTDIEISASDTEEGGKPQVFVLSSGEITPEFSVAFFIPTVATRYIVKGNFDGRHLAEIED